MSFIFSSKTLLLREVYHFTLTPAPLSHVAGEGENARCPFFGNVQLRNFLPVFSIDCERELKFYFNSAFF